MDTIFSLVIFIFLVYVIILLSYSMVRGAPFAALSKDRIKTFFELLKPVRGKRFLDLGSGDERIIIEASKYKLDSYGFEINPILLLISIIKIKRTGSDGKVFLKDYWREDLSNFDYIAVWGVTTMMGRLEKKLLKELKPGAKVVSNHLTFPNWRCSKKKNDVYLYIR